MYLIVIGGFRPCLLCSLLLTSSVLPSSLLAHPSFTTTTFSISLHPPLASPAASYLHLASFPGSWAGPSPFLIYFSHANITRVSRLILVSIPSTSEEASIWQGQYSCSQTMTKWNNVYEGGLKFIMNTIQWSENAMTNQLLIVLSCDNHVTHFIDRSKLFLESLLMFL